MTTMHLPPSGYWRTLKKNATVQDVAHYMVDIVKASSSDPFVNMQAEHLQRLPRRTNILQELANNAYDIMTFEPDLNTLQTIRTPRRSFRDRKANCVDYTVYIASIALALGLPVTIRIVQLEGQSNYGHVFPIVDGVIVDVVPGQDQLGRESFARIHKYPELNKTWPYITKQDFFI